MEAGRKLHIGGKVYHPDWEVLSLQDGGHVDHLRNANDLSIFDDGTFTTLYASHVLEHFDYQEELLLTLKEWHRVLEPGGTLHVAVPDMEQLCSLFIEPSLTPDERFHVMRIIFGGHVDENDYHLVGLDFVFLRSYLEASGFTAIERVSSFGIFHDTSELKFKGVPVSCNTTARKSAHGQ